MGEIYEYCHLSSSGAVKSGPGLLHSIVLSAGSANATATVYDETSAGGDVMCVVTALANDSVSAVLDVAFGVGCYVSISGTGALVTAALR